MLLPLGIQVKRHIQPVFTAISGGSKANKYY